MIDINWKSFELKHPKATDAFESLCYYLFCRRYGLNEGIRTDFNQVGLETEPIQHSDGKYYGFQSKFFEKNVNYTNIIESIDKALANYVKLDHIVIYINQAAQTSCKGAQKIETKCAAKGVAVEWYLPSNFKVTLNQPSNLDLAEFYFGATNVLGMLSDGKSIRMSTLLQSQEYLELNLHGDEKTLTITEYIKYILDSSDKLHLFTGGAGTGKSVCMRKMLFIYGGFAEQNIEKQLEKVQSLGALCIYINLNNTSLDSLENIILNYKSTYFADSNNNHFIYLFDGIDEVPKSAITTIILFIESLLDKEGTKKIIISSRSSSYNKYILKASFPDIIEYSIDNLKKEQVLSYFKNKGDEEKCNKLEQVSNENVNLYDHISDILTVSLLWDQINFINGKTYLTYLMKLSISAILNSVHHRKYLDSLNLPNPKDECIIEINKRVTFYLFENDHFSITYQELFNIIGDLYPRCDYTSSNEIISYLAESFFDITLTNEAHTFSYQHRRFSEYFIILQLEDKVRNDLNYLRKNDIIINYDLFELMLIPHLQNKAIELKDLPLSFEIGLLNVYLGNDRAWGVDKSFHIWSDWIVYSIAGLGDEIFESVITDKALPIYKFFNEVPEGIIASLSSGSKKTFDEEFRQNFKGFVLLIVLMHKLGKADLLQFLLTQYRKISVLCRENNYHFNSISNKDNYFFWRSITYINIVILQNDIDEKINSTIQNTQDINIDNLFEEHVSTNIFYLSSLYYNMIIYCAEKLIDVIKRMNLNQLSVFAIAAAKPECLSKISGNSELIAALKDILKPEICNENLSGIICLALKQMLGCTLSKVEKVLVHNYFEIVKFMSHSVFWRDHCDTVGLLIAAFDTGRTNSNIDHPVQQYAVAFSAFWKLVNKSYSLAKFIRCIQGNLNSKSEEAYYIRILLGKALALSSESDLSIKGAIDYINTFMNRDGGLLSIYHTMKLNNPIRFKKVLSITNIKKINTPTVYRDINFTSTSESLFILSFVTSSHDAIGGYDLLLQGISNGMMRMNDRKDTLGDYRLLESLEVILRNNWYSTEEIIALVEKMLKIAEVMNAYHIDNDIHGIAIESLIKYDFNVADYYYGRIKSNQETYNSIHCEYAMAMVHRGRRVADIEACLSNITASFDRYHQKVEWDSFYYRIRVYLGIANCDFYSPHIQKSYFKKTCEEIDNLEEAGWDRRLENEEYEIYIRLCKEYSITPDAEKVHEIYFPSSKIEKESDNILEILMVIEKKEDLDEFLTKLVRDYSVESFEINDLLIRKCIDIHGNIDGVFNLFSKSYYPSSSIGSKNNRNFWMTVASALKNPKSKNMMLEFLLLNGGGHDGFNELIKIYGHLGNREICVKAFETMISCIEFLLLESSELD